MPKVSIITTAYNHHDFIAQTIESVLVQTYSDRELLIGDDSPDTKTWDIIQSYVQKYPDKIKAWHHTKAKGLVQNMKFLLNNSDPKSTYIAFLEGDDMYTPDNLQKKISIFERYSEVWVVTSRTQFCDARWNQKTNPYIFSPESSMRSWLQKYTVLSILRKLVPPVRSFGNVMIRSTLKDPIVDINIWPYANTKMFITFDLLVWSKIFPITTIYNMNDTLFIYRQHDKNHSSPINFKQWLEQTIYVYSIYKDHFPKECRYLTTLVYAKIFALTWNYKKAIHNLCVSIKLFPFSHIIYKTSILLDIFGIKSFVWKVIKKVSYH